MESVKSVQVFSVMEQGASHREKNLPLQDHAFSEKEMFVSEKYTGEYAIAAISDGHGSPQYFRSKQGAEFACQAVKDVFCTFMENAKHLTDNNKLIIKRLIYEKWHDLVINDIEKKSHNR